MNEIIRLSNLGVFAPVDRAPAYENEFVKGYVPMQSVVSDDFHFVLAVSIGDLHMHIGDKFRNLVFLAAVSHPNDHNRLPTGFLCLETNAFLSWLFPAEGKDSEIPDDSKFYFKSTKKFLKDIEKTNQERSSSVMSGIKNIIKTLINFLLDRKKQENYQKHFLGVPEATTQSDETPTSKVNLSEADKELLMNAGRRVLPRLLAKAQMSNGPSNKVPIGAVNIEIITKKDIPPTNVKKRKPEPTTTSNEIIDLRTRGQKAADTRKENKAKELDEILEKQRQLEQKNREIQKQLQLQQQVPKQSQQLPAAKPTQHIHQPPPPPPSLPIPKPPSQAEVRSDMKMSFDMFEAGANSFFGFADRYLDKFVATKKVWDNESPANRSSIYNSANSSNDIMSTLPTPIKHESSASANTPRIPTPAITVHATSSSTNTPLMTTPEVSSSGQGEAKQDLEAAWKVIKNPNSWKTSSEMDAWLTKHGLVESGSETVPYLDLEYLDDTEVEELSHLLTTVPLRKFKKFMLK